MTLPELPGRVRIRERIGAGGFSTVWLGWDPELDSPVAVKVLADNWAARADVRERFLAEGRMLRRVDSDRLVRVYDVGELPDGRPYLVMTYAAGGTLADRHTAGGLAEPRARQVLAQVAEGLAVLHRHGIVHRDLNPHNILLRTAASDAVVLLADLGLAKEVAAASGLTQPGGTGGYMAPEQLDYSDAISPATDVYAYAVLARHLLGTPTDAGGAAVLAAAAAVDPAERPSLAEVAAVVVRSPWTPDDPAAAGATRTDSPTTRHTAVGVANLPAGPGGAVPPARPRRTARLVSVLVVGVVAALAALGGWWLARGGSSPGAPPAAIGSTGTPAAATTATSTTDPTSSPGSTSPGPSSTRPVGCTSTLVSVSAAPSSGGAAAPTAATELRLTARNTSAAPCALTGWPGVSLVGGDNGDQIGQPATRVGASGRTLTLPPGGGAVSIVRIDSPSRHPTCAVTPARGLRVYLPDTRTAIFVPVSGLSGCNDPLTPPLLTVAAFG